MLPVPVGGSAGCRLKRNLLSQTTTLCPVGRGGLFWKKHNGWTWFLLPSRGASSLLGLHRFSFSQPDMGFHKK